jgi:hypothetical protein
MHGYHTLQHQLYTSAIYCLLINYDTQKSNIALGTRSQEPDVYKL